jgi:hypothetical protein
MLLSELNRRIRQEARVQVEKQDRGLKTIGSTSARMLREDGSIRMLRAC